MQTVSEKLSGQPPDSKLTFNELPAPISLLTPRVPMPSLPSIQSALGSIVTSRPQLSNFTGIRRPVAFPMITIPNTDVYRSETSNFEVFSPHTPVSERKFKCLYQGCDMIFKRKEHLQRHAGTHQSELLSLTLASYEGQGNISTPFGLSQLVSQATISSPLTTSQSYLQSPTTPTANDRRYPCRFESCPKVFKRKEHLQRHFRSHTGEKPYQCPECLHWFSRNDNLNAHMKYHTNLTSPSVDRMDLGSANSLGSRSPLKRKSVDNPIDIYNAIQSPGARKRKSIDALSTPNDGTNASSQLDYDANVSILPGSFNEVERKQGAQVQADLQMLLRAALTS